MAEASRTATALFPTNSIESVRPAKISKIPAAIPYPTPTVIPQRNPFLILSDCPAPRFWLQNTEAEVAIASNGHMVNCLIFIAAVKADTYVLPSPLFADCITILPIAVMEN